MCKDCKCDCKSCKPTNADKWRYTLITTVIFLIVTHPGVYNMTQKLLGKIIKISTNGCPTLAGLLIHATVFTIALRYVMDVNV
jgi:hypothetical protein